MTPKERAAMKQALKALENNLPINYVENGLGEKFPCFSNDPLRESNTRAAIIALREALAEQALQKLSDFHQSIEQADEEGKTTDYILGFSDGKNYAHKYEQAKQEHDGHWSDCSVHNEPAYPNGPCDCGGYPPKHWRCACGANLYIDSNGAPASKAEQAEQPVSQEYQDHLVNQSFDWAAMAAKHQLMEGYRIGLAEMREKCAKVCLETGIKHPQQTGQEACAAAIRAINFEGDTGFRPVSEMIAERADGEQWSSDDMAYRPGGLSMEQAEQEPVAWMVTSEGLDGTPKTYPLTGRFKDVCDMCDFGDPIPLYAAPFNCKGKCCE